jgi:DNA repair exonuclease SbcCD ATPase subunit
MGRPALITYEQVKAVIDALRADGAKPTIDRIWEALHKAGSKGTVHKLAKQYFADLEGTEKAPESLRLLPPDVQRVILAFADDAAATMREKIAEEPLESKREAASLADDNERLTAELDDLRTQVAQAVSDKAAAHGRAEQLANELVAAREEIGTERAASERARTALAKAELRLEAIGPLEEELRQSRTERDAQREARSEAERVVAVLSSQQKEHEDRVQELKSSLARIRDACARLESRNGELADALERERQARAVAERERAVLAAVQAKRPGNGTKAKKNPVQQEVLWQGGGNDISGH